MEFKFEETMLFELRENELKEANSYMILSKNEAVKDAEIENIIQIVDESGIGVNCTYDKFVEIFDEEGLAGFII